MCSTVNLQSRFEALSPECLFCSLVVVSALYASKNVIEQALKLFQESLLLKVSEDNTEVAFMGKVWSLLMSEQQLACIYLKCSCLSCFFTSRIVCRYDGNYGEVDKISAIRFWLCFPALNSG